MPYERFFIAPYDSNSGLQNDVKPFLIPEQAFSRLDNAYQWRGRVRKRFGSKWLGPTQDLTRLKVSLGTTDGAGNLSGTVPGLSFSIGQAFSIGTAFYTVITAGAVQPMLQTVATTTATYSTTNGAYNFVGASANTVVYFYPAQPVMGLITYNTGNQNDYSTIAFDQQFSYSYEPTGWERITGEADASASIWTGSNSQLFWGTSYGATNANDFALFVTNFNPLESNGMRYLLNDMWNNFMPQVSAVGGTVLLVSASILVPFKNHLLAFNVWEKTDMNAPVQYPFRVRWSAIGDPTSADAWREDIPGRGNGLDCPSNEAIITVEYQRDRIFVKLERSTWELVYQNNEIQPFAWQQINPEFGAESRFSSIPIETFTLGISDIGVTACNGTAVNRIDANIPDEIFNIHQNNAGPDRVVGIRDYTVEMVYWAYPTPSRSSSVPWNNKILVFNYKTNTWAINDDSITAFGYFQQTEVPDWSSKTTFWDDTVPWTGNVVQSNYRNVIAGNQEGFTFLIDANVPSLSSNLQISNIQTTANPNILTLTIYNHNIDFSYVYFEGIVGTGNLNLLNGKIFAVLGLTDNTIQILYEDNAGNIINGTYSGGGTCAMVPNINIYTKQYNFYFKNGRNFYVPQIDFLVDTTRNGQLSIDYYVSTNLISMVNSSIPVTGTSAIVGTNILETSPYTTVPFESNTTQVWHRVYFQGDGEFIQLRMYWNDEQIRNVLNSRFSDFQLHAMTFYATQTSYWNI